MKRLHIIPVILVAIALCGSIAFAANDIHLGKYMNDTAKSSIIAQSSPDSGHSALHIAQARSPQNRSQPRDPEKFNEMIAWRIIKYLDLNEEQSDMFIPIFKESNKLRGSLMRKKDELVMKLAEEADNENVSIQELQKQLDDIKKLNQAIIDERSAFNEKMSRILTEKQLIKLEIFEDKFRIDLSKRFEENRQRRRESDKDE